MVSVLLLYMLFASTYTLGKMVLFYIPPILFIAIRMTLGGALLLAYQYWFNNAQWRYDRRDFGLFARIALFLMYLAFVTEFWALQYVTAAKASLLYNMSPFVTAVIAYMLLRKRLSKRQLVGLFIGFVSFVPSFASQGAMEQLTTHLGFISMPELMLSISVIASCYGWILMQKLVTKGGYSPIMVNGLTMLWAGGLSFVTSLFLEGRPTLYPSESLFSLSSTLSSLLMVGIYTVLLVLIAHVICFNLYAHLLRRYSATFIAFAGFTTPLFAAFYDFILWGQRVPVAFFVTVGGVLIGLSLFYKDELLESK